MKKPRSTPKYVKVREQLRKRIDDGEFPPGSRLPPETQLFKMLGASDSTVVRALNELVREGVIVRRRGDGTYVADRKCPPLIVGRALRLAVLFYTPVVRHTLSRSTFVSEIGRGVLKEWGVEGVEPEYIASSSRKTTEAVWRQPERGVTVEFVGQGGGHKRCPPVKAIREGKFDGIITVGIIEDGFFEKLLKLELPTVIVDFPTQKFGNRADLVYVDPQTGFRTAIEHFLNHGRRRIHFVGARIGDPYNWVSIVEDGKKKSKYGKRVDPDSFLRLSAYRQAMDACGVEVPEAWVHFMANDTELQAPFAKQLAELPEKDRPEAVVCHGAYQAEWIIAECGKLGLDLAGAGACDSVHRGRAFGIRVDPMELGTVAADLLITRIQQRHRPYLNVGVRMVFDRGDGVEVGLTPTKSAVG